MMLSIKHAELTFNANTNIEKKLFTDLNIDFVKGDFTTIIGPNGSGKSSILNVITGVYRLDAGEIILRDQNITHVSQWKRARYIGRVFQNPMQGLAPDLTLIENFAVMLNKREKGSLHIAVTKKNKDRIKEELLALRINLEDKLECRPGELSGGQCQAAALILAVLSEPLILLLDEHTAALDPKSAKNIMELTEKLIQDKKITAIMVTHNINDALRYGDRMVMMKEGNVILDIRDTDKEKISSNDIFNMYGMM